ncbi:MAG: hypothetical protein ABIF77_13400 [bacterium]
MEREPEIVNMGLSSTLPKLFNGKTVLRPLLCVHFRAVAGGDAMARAVRDPDLWRQRIEALQVLKR